MYKAFPKIKSKYIKTLFKTLVSLFLVYVLFRMIDWNESWELVRSVDFGFLFLYTFLLIVGIGISSYKWKQLADFLGFTFSFGRYFQWYLAGTFVNNFFPSIIGGDTYRAFSLGKKNDNRGDAIASVLFDRYTGLVSMAILAVLFSLFVLPNVFEHFFWMIVLGGAFVGVMAQVFFLPGKKWSFFALLFKFFPKKAKNIAVSMEKFHNRALTIKTFLLGSLFSLVGIGLANFILFRAFGVSFELVDFLSVIFFINIISAIPLSINNIGVKEWAYFIFFGYLGIAPEISVTVALVSRFIQMIVSLFGVPLFLWERKKEKIRIK